MSLVEPKHLRRPDGAAFVIALLLAMIAAVIIWQTSLMRVPPIQARVGPTVLPYVIAGGLILLSIGTAVSAFRGSFPEREPIDIRPMLWIIGGLLGQMLLVGWAGFSLGTAVLFAMVAKGFGRGPLWLTLPIGFVLAFAIWFVFARGLQLSLPTGPIERLIP